MTRILFAFFCLTLLVNAQPVQKDSPLTIPMIMQRPVDFIGSLPSNIYWSEDSKIIYFNWNPESAESDSLYAVAASGGTPRKLTAAARKKLPARQGSYTDSYSHKVYSKDGDLYILTIKSGKIRRITQTNEPERNPTFLPGKQLNVVYQKGDNLYRWDERSGAITQLTDFKEGSKPSSKKPTGSDNEEWLKRQEKSLVGVLKKREERRELAKKRRENEKSGHPKPIYLGDEAIDDVSLSPDGRFVTFRTVKENSSAKRTNVPDYVRSNGYTENLPARPKVGSPQDTYRFGVYDTVADTVYYASPADIPGIDDAPHWITPADSVKKMRNVIIYGPYWSENGKRAVVVVRAWDNKDRWIMRFNPVSAKLEPLHREHNDAWVGGPGISGWVFVPGNIGWLAWFGF